MRNAEGVICRSNKILFLSIKYDYGMGGVSAGVCVSTHTNPRNCFFFKKNSSSRSVPDRGGTPPLSIDAAVFRAPQSAKNGARRPTPIARDRLADSLFGVMGI